MAWAAVGVPRTRRPRRSALRWVRSAATWVGLSLLLLLLVGPATGRWRVVPVLSGSMEPRYPVGALVLAAPMPSTHLALGDVVLFEAPVPGAPTVMHRVVAVEATDEGLQYRTKGDANPAVDPWRLRLSAEQAWRVRGGVPLVGRASVLLQQRPAGLAVLFGGVLLVGGVALRAIWSPSNGRRAGEHRRSAA